MNLWGGLCPQGTTVYPLLTSVLYDDTQWEKPLRFHPPHFLDQDGKFVRRDAFMPFSAGWWFLKAEPHLNATVLANILKPSAHD